MRPELTAALTLARTLPADELPEFVGALETIRVTALARVTTSAPTSPPDSSLDVSQASARLGVSEDYLYRHHKKFKFTRREGRKLLFSSAGLDAYLKKAR